jgi:hypothetical protein
MKKAAGEFRGLSEFRQMVVSVRVPSGGRRVGFELGQFVLDFELLALEGSYTQVIVTDVGHLGIDLAIELPMAPLESGDVAFSRHDNSFQRFGRFSSSQIFRSLSTAAP